MRFDYSALDKALYRLKKSKEKETRKLAMRQGNVFVRMAKKISFQKAPDPSEILDIGLKLGGRLRRKKGMTVMAEIGRRISKIGTLARNWRFWKVESQLGRIRVWIRDNVNYSKVVDDQQHLIAQAAKLTQKSLNKAMQKSIKKITGDFNHGRQ